MTPTAFGAQRESRCSCLPCQGLWTCQSHGCAPTETRLDWSPLAKETSQLQLGRSETLLGGRGGTSVWAVSLQTSFSGGHWDQNKQVVSLLSFLLLAQAVCFTLWGQGQFELLRLGQQPSLVFSHDCCGCGLAELTFLQVPRAGALLAAMTE